MSFLESAFKKVCHEAENAEQTFVSLYVQTCQYGGPEEGGWYRHDVELVRTQRFPTEEIAKSVAKRVAAVASRMSAEAKRQHSEQMSRECDWCERRGLDADYLPEPDGPDEYQIVVEKVPGSRTYRAPAVYE